jgi:hypothetical protein
MSSANIHLEVAKLFVSLHFKKGTEVMERRDFLKIAMGLVAGGAALAASGVQAAPLPPVSGEPKAAPAPVGAEPAVVSQDDIDHIKPEEVRWHGHHRGWHHHHRGWHHRHWGWHRRWHHRHWHHHRHW